jgi:hypothetical protein
MDVGLPFNGTAPDIGYLETTPPVVYAVADFNHDTHVDDADLAIWAANFGLDAGALASQGDAETNGDVGGGDFLTWQQQWDPQAAVAPSATNVPEPTGLAVTVGGLMAVRTARRRARSGKALV